MCALNKVLEVVTEALRKFDAWMYEEDFDSRSKALGYVLAGGIPLLLLVFMLCILVGLI